MNRLRFALKFEDIFLCFALCQPKILESFVFDSKILWWTEKFKVRLNDCKEHKVLWTRFAPAGPGQLEGFETVWMSETHEGSSVKQHWPKLGPAKIKRSWKHWKSSTEEQKKSPGASMTFSQSVETKLLEKSELMHKDLTACFPSTLSQHSKIFQKKKKMTNIFGSLIGFYLQC